MAGVQATIQVFVVVITNLIFGFRKKLCQPSICICWLSTEQIVRVCRIVFHFKFCEPLNIRDLPIDILDILKPPAWYIKNL